MRATRIFFINDNQNMKGGEADGVRSVAHHNPARNIDVHSAQGQGVTMTIEKYGSRYWAVYNDDNTLICVTVYKKGAKEVIRRLAMEIREAKSLLSKAHALNILREKHETVLL